MNTHSLISLKNLPTRKICIKLPPNIQRKMVEEAIGLTGSLISLARAIGVNWFVLRDFRDGRFGSTMLESVEKLSSFLVEKGFKEYALDEIQLDIVLLKAKRAKRRIYNPISPMNFNSKYGAQIVSSFLFDGGVQEMLP